MKVDIKINPEKSEKGNNDGCEIVGWKKRGAGGGESGFRGSTWRTREHSGKASGGGRTMNRREQMLALGVACLVGLLILYYLVDSVSSAFEARHKQIDDLNQRIAKKNEEIQTGDRGQEKIKDWQRRSLPTDSAWASSLYQNWLLSLVGDAKLGSATVQQQASVAGRSATSKNIRFK